MKSSNKPKVIVVLGPTASGKSSLGERLSLEFNGEIISADSRQVYRRLNIGSGKETLKVTQHCLDIAEPGERVNVHIWKEQAEQAIDDLVAAGKVPVVVGGSSLYVQALIDNFQFSPEDGDGQIRQELDVLSSEELQKRLREQDPVLADHLEPGNRRYLMRALEKIALAGTAHPTNKPSPYEFLLLGTKLPRPELYRRIDERVDRRLDEGMLAEVEALLAAGVSPDWLDSLGLEYRYLSRFLTGKITNIDDAVAQLKFAIHHFARRQELWWNRFSKSSTKHSIQWVDDWLTARELARSWLST